MNRLKKKVIEEKKTLIHDKVKHTFMIKTKTSATRNSGNLLCLITANLIRKHLTIKTGNTLFFKSRTKQRRPTVLNIVLLEGLANTKITENNQDFRGKDKWQKCLYILAQILSDKSRIPGYLDF